MTRTITLRATSPVTHDTNRFSFDRPEGISWTPGQATKLAIDKDGWRDEAKPFTMVGDPGADSLDFVIKSYPAHAEGHDGVTEQIGRMQVGETLVMGDIWGAIEDRGPGVFLAGGAGITPFIGILQQRARDHGGAGGSVLIFSNTHERDIILREEWEAMDGLETLWTLTEENKPGMEFGEIDGDFLDRHVTDWDRVFYACGPRGMEDDLIAALRERGVPEERIVSEDHPD